jgi:hypothetical protein
MRGRVLVLWFLGFVVVFAAALVYFQFFAFYDRVAGVRSLTVAGDVVPVAGYDGIDASSSPLKLRGCFTLDPALLAGLEPAQDATPLTAPPWFGCFDAGRLTEDLASGGASAYAAARDAPEGFDVMLAVYPDGRGYIWRQLGAAFRDP